MYSLRVGIFGSLLRRQASAATKRAVSARRLNCWLAESRAARRLLHTSRHDCSTFQRQKNLARALWTRSLIAAEDKKGTGAESSEAATAAAEEQGKVEENAGASGEAAGEEKSEEKSGSSSSEGEPETGEDGESGQKKRRSRKRNRGSGVGTTIYNGVFFGVLGGLAYAYWKLTKPEVTMPLVLNNLDKPLVPLFAQGLSYYMQLSGSALPWREAMADANGVAILNNYMNDAEATPEAHRLGMSLLSLLAEYEKTRPSLRHATIFKTAAHYLKSDDFDVKGAALNVLIFMFQDKPSATLVVNSGVLKLMCDIASKAFEDESNPEHYAAQLALKALSKIPHHYPGGVKELMKRQDIDEKQLNCLFVAMQSDLMEQERQGDYESALKTASECINMNPKSPQFYQISARIQSSQGNVEGAIWNLRRAIKLGLRQPQHRTFFVQLLLESGRPKYLVEAREVLLGLIGEKFAMYNRKDDSKQGSSMGGGVNSDLRQILAPTSSSVSNKSTGVDIDGILGQGMRLEALYVQLIKADMMLQDFRMAGVHVEDWLKHAPESSPALYFKAKILSNIGQLEEALKLVGESIEIGPERPEAIYLKAHLLHRLNRDDDALVECDSVVKMLRRDTERRKRLPNLHLLMGKLYEAKEDYVKAEKSYSSLIKLDPERPMPHFRRAKVLLKQGNKAEAEAEFSEVLRIWQSNCGQTSDCRDYFRKNEAAQLAFRFIHERSKEELGALRDQQDDQTKSVVVTEMEHLCKQLDVAF